MPTDEERLLELASGADRICPVPIKWQEFWRLIGAPQDLPPLVLSGWAFSTDRQKRERFLEEIKRAASAGHIDAARAFIEALPPEEWHTNRGGDLDWSYGDTILEEIDERKRALKSAREHYERLRALEGDSEAFSREHFARTLFKYYLLFERHATPVLAEALRASLKHFDHLTIGNEVSLLEGTPSSIAAALLDIRKGKEIELLMLEIIDCITGAGVTMDRDAVDGFVEEMFADPE